jgi:hypothetical protein
MRGTQGIRGRIALAVLAGAVWTCVASGGATGTATTAPSNDNFANAIALTGAIDSRSGDTNVGATLEPGEATTVAGKAAGTSVWYSWQAPGDGLVVIDTATSGFDTLLGVYTGGAVNALTVVASNDDVKNTVLTSRVRFPATSGTVYRIRVDGFMSDSGAINLRVHQAPPPVNDVFSAAIEVFQDVEVTGTNDGATLETGEDSEVSGFPGGASVWYWWTAPESGKFVVDTATSSFDTLLGVYTGGAVGSLTEVASNDDTKTLTSQVRFTATGGLVYRIRVDGFAEASGSIKLHLHETPPVASPANDNFASAISPPPGLTTSASGTTAGATLETNEPPLVAFEPAGASVWYSWTAPATGAVRIDTATSGFDTLVGVYTGGAVSGLTDVASNDDAGTTDLTSSVTFHATASTLYMIRVDGYAGDAGTFALHLNEVPDPPTSVSATAGVGEATVTWNIPANNGGSPIIGYDVTRYVSGVAQGTTSVGVVTQATITGLTNGTTYTFRVAAKNATGTGALSSESNAVTPRTVPDAPTSVTATPGAGQATVHWSAPAFNGGSPITGYDVTPYIGAAAQTTTSVGAAPQTTITGLTNGTTYTFKVVAKNVAGSGVSSTASNPVTPRTVPDAPTSVSATPGPGEATVTWSAPAFNGGSAITGYDVTRYVGGIAESTTSLGLVTQATLSGLLNGTTYTFRVAARNVAGPGALSDPSNAVTPRTVPDAPTNVAAIPGDAQATVSWSAPFDEGSAITGYDVTSYVAGVALGTTSVGAVTQATLTGLTNGTAYTFRVVAKNAIGAGAQSSPSNTTTPRTVPDAPTGVSATIAGAGQAVVSWSAPAFDGGNAITAYEVTTYAAGVSRGKITVGVATQTTFGGLTNGTTYTFRVAAKNAAGTGAQSSDSNGVTPASPKFPLTVTKSGAGAGTVTSSVGSINCGAACAGDFDQGTIVTLTAVASSGSMFAGWSAPCTGVGTCTIPIDAAKTVTAKFDQLQTQPQDEPQQGAKCVVPNVKRKPLATAKRKLAAAHCKTGKVTKAKSATVPKGRVISQKTSAGKRLAAGSKVNLVVSRGKR